MATFNTQSAAANQIVLGWGLQCQVQPRCSHPIKLKSFVGEGISSQQLASYSVITTYAAGHMTDQERLTDRGSQS